MIPHVLRYHELFRVIYASREPAPVMIVPTILDDKDLPSDTYFLVFE